MGFTNLCFRRSASMLASSVCGGRVGRVQSISTVVNRSSLVHNPSPIRPFVSRGYFYSTATTDDDWISSEQDIIRVIDDEINGPVVLDKKDLLGTFVLSMWKGPPRKRITPPASFPFKIEDIPGNRTVTLTREYNGEHIKILVSMPLYNDDDEDDGDDDAPSNESKNDEDDVTSTREYYRKQIICTVHGDDDAPNNESNDEDDDDDSKSSIPFFVTVTKRSGRSLELSCKIDSFNEIVIDAIHVNLPGEDPKVLRDMDDSVEMDHDDMKKRFNKYLQIRGLEASTLSTISLYMCNKMCLEYWLWLENVKEFLEE